MKPSHFTTPRTLADSTFATNADPIEHPTGYSTGWWACITVIAVLAAIVISATAGSPL